jgi:hypothetical protein
MSPVMIMISSTTMTQRSVGHGMPAVSIKSVSNNGVVMNQSM